VRLTASNAGGQNTNTKTAYIVVSAPVSPPVAGFEASPTSGTAPLNVQFTDQSTGAASWSWNFGDGASSADPNPMHIYGSGGSFTVTLTVSNSAGPNSKTRVGYITVAAPPLAPGADFTANPLSGTVPLNVQFTDQSTGSPTAWAWTFGDGGTSSQRNPSHTYTTAGSFTVLLTVSNAAGQTTRTRANYVTVSPPAAVDYFCSSMVIEAGKLVDGDHESVHAADDSYLRIKASQLDGAFSDVITYSFDTRLASLSSLAITSESRSKAAPVRQQILLFNYSSGQWEQIDDREISTKKEITTTVGVTNPARYLSASGEVRVRIKTGDVSGGRWKHFVNLVKITAAP
jgi:PKD repeat protein